MGWFVIILLLVIIIAVIIRQDEFSLKERQLSFVFLLFKLAGGLTFYGIYVFHYGYGDSLEYYKEAQIIGECLSDNINNSLLLYQQEAGQCLVESIQWTDQLLHRHFQDPDSFFFIKIAGLFAYLGVNTYYKMTIVFSLISFLICFSGVIVLKKAQRDLAFDSIMLALIIPSVLVWSSGVSKDNLVFSSSFVLLMLGFSFLTKFKLTTFSFLTLLIASILLLKLKPIFFTILALSFLISLLLKHLTNFTGSMVNILIVMPAALFLVVLLSFVMVKVFHQEVFDIIHRASKWNSYGHQGSSFSLSIAEYDTKTLISKGFSAIILSLFRPFIWEAKNSMMLLQSIENIILLVFGCLAFFKSPKKIWFKGLGENRASWFLLLAGIFILAGVGLSTYNFGVVSRFRISGLTSLAFAFLLLLHQTSSKYRTT